MDASDVQFLNGLSDFLRGNVNHCNERPKFDGTHALKFIEDFEDYCGIARIAKKDKVHEMLRCVTSPSLAARMRRECVTVQNGESKSITWVAAKAWFSEEFAVSEDADNMVKLAMDQLLAPSSNMRPQESMVTYITRFNDLIHNINYSRRVWNEHNQDVADARKYPVVSELERNTWFLERVNEYHFQNAHKFKAARDEWSDIIEDLKTKDNIRIRKNRKFPNRSVRTYRDTRGSPTETLNESSITLRNTSPSSEDELQKFILEQKRELDKVVKALEKEKVQHNKTREQAVKGVSFPINEVSTDKPQSDDTSASDNSSSKSKSSKPESRCYICKEFGHYGTSCTKGLCSRCGEPHALQDCLRKAVDCWCPLCFNIGHIESMCPYSFIGRLGYMKQRTREEAVINYRAKMEKKNKKAAPKPDKSNKPPKNAKKYICRNFQNGYGCARTPCPWSHDAGGSHTQDQKPRRNQSRSPPRRRNRSRSPPRGRKRSRSLSRGRNRSRSPSRDRQRRKHKSRSKSRSRSPKRRRQRNREGELNYIDRSQSSSRSGRSPAKHAVAPPPIHIVDPKAEKYVSISTADYNDLVLAQIERRQLLALTQGHKPNSAEATDGLTGAVTRMSALPKND